MKNALRAAAMVAVAVSTALLLCSCPLPFEYSPEDGASGGDGSNDPANPSVTAAPTCLVVSKITGEELTTVDSDALVLLDSGTRGAVIYYRIIDPSQLDDPPMPEPGADGTLVYNPSNPPEVAGHLSSFAFVAMAIGPNMYPSLLVCGEIQVQYTMAATPVFSSLPDSWPPEVAITSSDPDATIYYEQVSGPGPAPDPVPGTSTEYTGPIVLSGQEPTVSFSAIAVVDQKENSYVGRATFYPATTIPTLTIDDTGDRDDGYINIQENTAGVSAWIAGAVETDAAVSYAVISADNCSVTPTTGVLDGSPVELSLTGISEGTVTIEVEFSDEFGTTARSSDSSVADLTRPAQPTLQATSNGITIDPGGSRSLENRTLFRDNARFSATTGGSGGGGWQYQAKRGAGPWSGWVTTSPTSIYISSYVSSGSMGDLEVEFRECDAAGNWSDPANVLVTVDRRPSAYTVELFRSGFLDITANTRLTVWSRVGGVGFNIHLEIFYDGVLDTVFDGPVACPIGDFIWQNTWSRDWLPAWNATWSGFYEFDSYGNILGP